MEPWSALVEDQVRVTFWPAIIAAGAIISDAVGAGVVPPPPPLLLQLVNAMLKPSRSAHHLARALNPRRKKALTTVKHPIPFHILLVPKALSKRRKPRMSSRARR